MSWLLKYREAISNGEFIVGQELLTALDMYIADLENPEYIYDTTKANVMIDFMENCIRLTKSPFYNQPMKLMLWQKAFIECLYSFKMFDKDLNKWVDRFTEAIQLIARKNTKSETSSAICDTEMFIGGEGMDIICASNTYDQSDILFEACDLMRQLIDPSNLDSWRNRKGLRCTYNNNKITKMSERTKGKEGKNIDIAVVDEVHEMIDDSLIKPIEQSMSIKDNKKLILITTEGFTNDGYLDNKLKEVRAILKGEDTSFKSKRILIWLYTQDSEQEVWNVNDDGINPAWQKSNPTLVYGIKKWSYLRDQVDGARKSKSDRMFVLSKDFNFKVANGQAWLLKEDYDYTSDFNIEDFKNTYCLGSVDLAETTDLCNAKIMLIKKDSREKFIVSHYWIAESKLENSDDKNAGAKYLEWVKDGLLTICEGDEVDLTLIADWFYSFQEKYNIRIYKCGYDQRFKADWVKRMEYYGWTDKEDLIMINQSPDVLHNPNNQVETGLKNKLIIGLNDMDKWCLSNAALKVNNVGKSLVVKLDNQKSKRIDGAVSLIILQETFNRYKSDLLDII